MNADQIRQAIEAAADDIQGLMDELKKVIVDRPQFYQMAMDYLHNFINAIESINRILGPHNEPFRCDK